MSAPLSSLVCLYKPAGVTSNAPSLLKPSRLKKDTRFSSWKSRNDWLAGAAGVVVFETALLLSSVLLWICFGIFDNHLVRSSLRCFLIQLPMDRLP